MQSVIRFSMEFPVLYYHIGSIKELVIFIITGRILCLLVKMLCNEYQILVYFQRKLHKCDQVDDKSSYNTQSLCVVELIQLYTSL